MIVVMHAVQHRQADDLAIKTRRAGRCGWHWNGLGDALVRSGVIEILDIFRDILQQLPFAQEKHKVQALAPQTAEEPLTIRIRAARRWACGGP